MGKSKICLLFVFVLMFITQVFSYPCYEPFLEGRDYFTGSKVSYLGRNYQSVWSTREIPGVQNWGGWRDLGVCQVETVIDLSDPSQKDAPQPIHSISQFLLFATNNLNLNSGVKISGNIGANGNVSLGMSAGWQTIINGDIYSRGSVTTTAEAVINGNIYANGGVQLGWQAKHNGEVIRDHDYNFSIARKTIPTSSQNVSGKWREDVKLSPGNYRDVSVRDGGSLELSKGVYNLRTLALNSNDLEIKLNIAPGENVQLNVQDSIHLGSGTKITFTGKKSPLSLKIYTNQTSDLIIPDHSEINAIITAPNARVVVNSGARVNGAIFAREVEVKYGAVINSIPYITDVFHSQYHFAPHFDKNTAEYFSLISTSANIDFAEVNALSNYRVTQTNIGDRYLFEIEDTIINIVSYYTLEFRRTFNHSVFVDSRMNGNGDSWLSALNCLRRAIELAKETGKEIRVAEGNYESVVIPQGVKIIGGFDGTEITEEPLGSPYKTIISGNNQTQAVEIRGFENARSVKIKGFTIQNGFSETNGGGISSVNLIPKLEEVIVRNNTASEDGAGIYAPRGVQDLHMVLLENNTGKNAFYLRGGDSIKAERVVVSQNSGVGLRAENTEISFVNSIFYGNKVAISAQNSEISLIHCTFAKNDTGVVSNGSNVEIVNTILWNERSELVGDGFNVSYSCVRGGFAGEGNVSGDPMFVDVNNPRGNDGIWGTRDDGLRLRNNSPSINSARNQYIREDFAFRDRPMQGGFDMGVYETIVPGAVNEQLALGFLTSNNEFKQHWPPIVQHGLTVEQLRMYRNSKGAVTFRIGVEKNKYTRGIGTGEAHINFIDENGRVLPGIRIQFYRNGETNSHYLFTSRVAENGRYVRGKPTLLVLEEGLASSNNPNFYLLPVPASLGGSIRIHVPMGQFR